MQTQSLKLESLFLITLPVRTLSHSVIESLLEPTEGLLSKSILAFVGFRPPRQLASIIRAVPEFAAMFQEPTLLKLEKLSTSPSPTKTDTKSVLRTLFDEAINLSPSLVKPLIQGINNRLKENEGDFKVFGIANQFGAEGDANATGETESAAMKRVWDISVKTYGEEDVGVLVSTCMMNLLRMKKGEGAWILGTSRLSPLKISLRRFELDLTLFWSRIADDLHAYVEGDIMECMAYVPILTRPAEPDSVAVQPRFADPVFPYIGTLTTWSRMASELKNKEVSLLS